VKEKDHVEELEVDGNTIIKSMLNISGGHGLD
jgi:hypothetical protein